MQQNFRVWLMGSMFISGMVVPAVMAQDKTVAVTSAQESKTKSTQPWSLKISKEAATLIGLKAQEAPLNELAQDLSRQLGIPIRLSPVMEPQRITAELDEASLENILRSLAPQAYLDETISVQDGTTQQWLGAYLSGLNEAKPERRAHLKEQNETVMFFGTIGAEGEAAQAEAPLQVKLENGLVHLRIRRQPVAVVLYEIAQQLGIPFEMRAQPDQLPDHLIDLEAQGQRLEDALRQLAAPIHLTRRLNLALNESEPLRIILLAQTAN
jgi:type II secretory pathway component GspD/PulD (secretin)